MQKTSLITKPHYPILDGLRGVAALAILLFHMFEVFYYDYTKHPIHHGYLTVDFFFLLSGFVIGYAYDDRWNKMTVWDFFKLRLIRLHPMVILSAVLAAVSFWINPYSEFQSHMPVLKFIGIMIIAIALIPTPDFRGWGETHSINGPWWSLFQEYIANIIYALFGRKLKRTPLVILVAVCAVVLSIVVVKYGTFANGWNYETFWIGILRMMFSFFAGLLLFRMRKLISIPWAFTVSSLLLITFICLPYFKYNGVYEVICVVIIFPIIVVIGAGGTVKGRASKICEFIGNISYPLYITHYPVIYIYMDWYYKKRPAPNLFIPVGIGAVILIILIAYMSLKLYDIPIRRWLKNTALAKNNN